MLNLNSVMIGTQQPPGSRHTATAAMQASW